jgi:N-acetylglutamate synthase-like GNAT family acetyltransferase
MSTQTEIRPATVADTRYLRHLQRKFSDALGFLPTAAIDWYAESGNVAIAEENGEPAGYLLGRPALNWQPLLRPIYQAAVAMDAQRRHHGLALLRTVEAAAEAAGQTGLQANCAAGLEANEFWHAAGFIPICYLTPLNCRTRPLICWRKPLTNKIPLWFSRPPVRHGHHAGGTTTQRNPQREQNDNNTLTRYISAKREPENLQNESATPR